MSVALLLLCVSTETVQAATIVVPAGGDLQAAINAAQYGDTIVLQAGATYERFSNGAPSDEGFALPYKGSGTGTDADYITIRTSNLAGIPLEGVRVSPANAGATAKIVANKVPTAVNIATNAHHYRFLGISFTNRANTGVHTHSLVAGPFYNPIGSHPHHIEFDRCLFYPIEEIDDPNGIARSVTRGVYINGSEITVKNSYLWGFTGRYKYGSTEIIDSECIITDGGPGPFHIINNFLEAWYNNIFTGGASLSTANEATVQSGATLTSATLSQSANLNVGDYISFKQPSGPNANAKVLTKGDNSITFTSLHRYGGGAVAPAAGSTAGWNGPTISNVEIRRNTFNKRPEWATAGIGSPKGYMEIKTADGLIIDGNIFQGSLAPIVITSRNQNGASPWMTVKNVTITNNIVREYGTAIILLMQDGDHLNQPGGDVTVANNLFTSSGTGTMIIQLSGGYDVQIYHNTALGNSNSIVVSDLATTGVVFRDNITGSGSYGITCALDGQLNTCWPSLVMNKNVVIDTRDESVQGYPFNYPGNNYYPTNINLVGFTDTGDNNYRLLPTSPYRNAATDGKDIGVDMNQLIAALGGSLPVPTPTPTPTPSPSPTPTPTPTATPTPSPTPSPSPPAGSFRDDFDGSALDVSKWTAGNWFANVDLKVANGLITLRDFSYIRSNQTWFQSTVESVVTLGPASHFGLATTLNGANAHWMIFSVRGGTTLARTRLNDEEVDTTLSDIQPDVPHHWKIVWKADNAIEFWVDDVLKATHTRAFSEQLPLYLSGPATADWLQVSTSGPPPTPTTTSAAFVQLDLTTQGEWKSAYGGEGYHTIGDATNYPSYAEVSSSGQSTYTWAASTSDVRALQKANGNDRIAATWYNSTFTIDLNLTDDVVHRVALYCLDWDTNLRAQRLDIVDAATGNLLDSRIISSFNGGQYLVWDIKGHVKVHLTLTGGANAVVSGLYFGPALAPSPTPNPSNDIVWVEDTTPAGATLEGNGEGWNWVSNNPASYSGTLASQSNIVSGMHQHYFYGASGTLSVNTGDTLVAYVYLDPSNPPSEVMLQWNNGGWEHRAYWGANNIPWGTDGTNSRRYMGPLPIVGQWVRLEVPASQVGLEGTTVNGMAFTLFDGCATWDHAGKSSQPTPTPSPTPLPSPTPTPNPSNDIVWVEDTTPAGATLEGNGEGWNWVSNNPASYSGTLASQSNIVSGMHQHYFYGASGTLSVNTGDTLVAYVYLDPSNPPSEVMLQWNNGGWEHRAYWGANNIPWGTDGTNSRRYMGPLPIVGQWVRLEVPASQVGLEGTTVNGMAFTLFDGCATWDHAGKAPPLAP